MYNEGVVKIKSSIIIMSFLMNQRESAYRKNSENILSMYENSSGDVKFLDLGCDNGKWTMKMAKKIGTKKVYGTEILEESANQAKKNGVEVSIGDLNKRLPYRDEMFDVVHANQVIEHLNDTDMFLDEIYRILKPGGYAVISTENLASWHNIGALILGFMPFSLTNISSKKAAIGNPLAPHAGKEATIASSWQHMRIFTIYGLKELSREVGFIVERVLASGYYPLGSWFSKIDPNHSHFLF